MSLSLDEFLGSCRAAELALEKGIEGADLSLQAVSRSLAEARWSQDELSRAGKALMDLRVKADSKSRFFRIRSQLSQTLARAATGAADKGPTTRIDKTF